MSALNNPTKILHIVQYLDLGGACRSMIAVAKYLSRQYPNISHDVISLLPPDQAGVAFAEKEGMRFLPQNDLNDVVTLMEQYDIVQLEWWNNAEQSKLVRMDLPPSRLAAWCHVGGHIPPQIVPHDLANYCDAIIGCSPHTYNCPAIQDLPEDERVAKAALAYDGADFERVAHIQPKAHEGFNIGYVGTVNFVKMHPDFIEMSSMVNIPEAKFIVCGGGGIEELLKKQAAERGMANKLELKGFVEDITPYLETFDVYGYPLCEDNYAGSELNLQEVMRVGIPPVVFPYGGVRYLVVNDFTGLVVRSNREYAEAIEYFYHNPEERKRLGTNAKEYAQQIFGAEKSAKEFAKVYERLLTQPKQLRKYGETTGKSLFEVRLTKDIVFDTKSDSKGAEQFIASLNGLDPHFTKSREDIEIEQLLEADNKIASVSTLMFSTFATQYLRCFPEDPYLHFWAGLGYRKQEDLQKAIESFMNAERYGFRHPRLYLYIYDYAVQVSNDQLAANAEQVLLQTLSHDKDVAVAAEKFGILFPESLKGSLSARA